MKIIIVKPSLILLDNL